MPEHVCGEPTSSGDPCQRPVASPELTCPHHPPGVPTLDNPAD